MQKACLRPEVFPSEVNRTTEGLIIQSDIQDKLKILDDLGSRPLVNPASWSEKSRMHMNGSRVALVRNGKIQWFGVVELSTANDPWLHAHSERALS